MGEALFELEQVLRSQKKDGITSQEGELLVACKSKALREFTLAGLLSGSVVWATTWKLNSLVRLSLAGGAAITTGMHRVGKCLDSCASHILSLSGTRMQHELAKIMVNRYGDDPRKMHLVAQYFYTEKVFDDSGTALPKRLFRPRNMTVDAAQSQKTSDSHGHDDHSDGGFQPSNRGAPNQLHKKDAADNAIQRIATEARKPNAKLGDAPSDDPLDFLFSDSNLNEEILQNNYKSGPPDSTRRQSRSQRRLHRKQRHHLQQKLSASETS